MHKYAEYYSHIFIASFIGLRIYCPIYLLSTFALISHYHASVHVAPCTMIMNYVLHLKILKKSDFVPMYSALHVFRLQQGSERKKTQNTQNKDRLYYNFHFINFSKHDVNYNNYNHTIMPFFIWSTSFHYSNFIITCQ